MPVSRANKSLAEYLQGKTPAERMAVMRDIQQHPDYFALQRLEDALTQAHFSPEVRASAVMSDFVFLMREVLAEYVPGTELSDLVEPLRRLIANHGGGRPPKADPLAVLKTQSALEAAWHPAPQRAAAKQHNVTDRTVRNYASSKKVKPG